MKEIITVPATEVRAGDDIKTSEGFINVGGVQPLRDKRVGLFTPKGLIGVHESDHVTVRRILDALP
jgi:hypothetical protein